MTKEETRISEKFRKSTTLSIDTKNFGYRGSIIAKEIKTKDRIVVALITDPNPSFYSNLLLVSHEGEKDFSVYFGHWEFYEGICKIDLVIVLSFGETLNFLTYLKRIDIKEEIAQKEDEGDKKPVSIPPFLTHDTLVYSPNVYLFTEDGRVVQIYFGRALGETEEKDETEPKPVRLFTCSVRMSYNTLRSLISAMEKNIAGFEEKHGVKLSDLTLSDLKSKSSSG